MLHFPLCVLLSGLRCGGNSRGTFHIHNISRMRRDNSTQISTSISLLYKKHWHFWLLRFKVWRFNIINLQQVCGNHELNITQQHFCRARLVVCMCVSLNFLFPPARECVTRIRLSVIRWQRVCDNCELKIIQLGFWRVRVMVSCVCVFEFFVSIFTGVSIFELS